MAFVSPSTTLIKTEISQQWILYRHSLFPKDDSYWLWWSSDFPLVPPWHLGFLVKCLNNFRRIAMKFATDIHSHIRMNLNDDSSSSNILRSKLYFSSLLIYNQIPNSMLTDWHYSADVQHHRAGNMAVNYSVLFSSSLSFSVSLSSLFLFLSCCLMYVIWWGLKVPLCLIQV